MTSTASEHLLEFWPGAPDTSVGFTPTGLGVFLRSKGMADEDVLPVIDGPDVPNDPGAMLVVTPTTGPGLSFEGIMDGRGFQVRTIGPSGGGDNRWASDAAGYIANRVDEAIIFHDYAFQPVTIGGRHVIEMRRSGEPPSVDRIDDADRAHWTCSYVADVATS